ATGVAAAPVMDDLKILRDSGLPDHRHEPIRQNRSVDKYQRCPGPADIILDVRPIQLYSFHSWPLVIFPELVRSEGCRRSAAGPRSCRLAMSRNGRIGLAPAAPAS